MQLVGNVETGQVRTQAHAPAIFTARGPTERSSFSFLFQARPRTSARTIPLQV